MVDQEQKNNETKSIEQLKNVRTETEDVILKRRSVRIFQKKQVPEFLIKRMLEAGRFAPSAGNCMPWKFVVVREPEILDGITQTVMEACKKFKGLIDYRYNGSILRRIIASIIIRSKPNDLHPVPFGAISLIADGKLGLFHNAPTVILIFADERQRLIAVLPGKIWRWWRTVWGWALAGSASPNLRLRAPVSGETG
jgi:nitroreductase